MTQQGVLRPIWFSAFHILQFICTAAELPRACDMVERAKLRWGSSKWGRVHAPTVNGPVQRASTFPQAGNCQISNVLPVRTRRRTLSPLHGVLRAGYRDIQLQRPGANGRLGALHL